MNFRVIGAALAGMLITAFFWSISITAMLVWLGFITAVYLVREMLNSLDNK